MDIILLLKIILLLNFKLGICIKNVAYQAEEILGLLQNLNEAGKTIILVTHEDEVAARTKRKIRLRDGAVIEDSPI